jgi:hypothetical protein
MTTPAYNCVFGWPIYSDAGKAYTPTRSGGSWLAPLPLTNLSDRRLRKVARSTNLLAASTQWETDLAVARDIGVIAYPYHNLTPAATVRIRLSNVAHNFAAPVYDTGVVNVWAAGLDAENTEGMNVGFTHVPAAVQNARYQLTEWSDPTNPAGYIDIGREIIAGRWQPSINMAPGAQLGLESATVRDETDGGATTFNVKRQRRTVRFSIEDLPFSEALTKGYVMERIAGLAGQIHFVYDPTQTTLLHHLAFTMVLRRLNGVEAMFAGYGQTAYEGVEEF